MLRAAADRSIHTCAAATGKKKLCRRWLTDRYTGLDEHSNGRPSGAGVTSNLGHTQGRVYGSLYPPKLPRTVPQRDRTEMQ